MLGSVAEEAKLGGCFTCCLADLCCPCLALTKLGMDTGAKYNIKEGCCSAFMKACCCSFCYRMQIMHEIMTQEKLHYGCACVKKDIREVTPDNAIMARP